MSIMPSYKSHISHILTIIFALTAINLAAQDSCWVQVRIPVACIRDGKGHSTELISQAIMGTPMLVLEDDGGEWLKLQGPDGYEGYMNISSISRKTESEMHSWRKSPRLVSKSMSEVKVYDSPTQRGARNIVTELVCSSIVEGELSDSEMTPITLPDGRKGWVESSAMISAAVWARQEFNADSILDRCYTLMGTPYLWGACSTKSVDCSGLVRVSYFANGLLLLRDARQQIEIGKRIEPDDTASLKPADLLFFSTTPDGKISHVAIYDKDGKYIHSSGLVKTNYMSLDDADYSKRCYRGASRIEGMIPSNGIIPMWQHRWYF